MLPQLKSINLSEKRKNIPKMRMCMSVFVEMFAQASFVPMKACRTDLPRSFFLLSLVRKLRISRFIAFFFLERKRERNE